MKTETIAYSTKTITVGNATVCIHRPILTESERKKRTDQVVTALRNYGKSIIGERKQ